MQLKSNSDLYTLIIHSTHDLITVLVYNVPFCVLQMGAESDEAEYYPDLSPSPSDEEDERMPALMEVSQQKEEEVGC